MRRVVEENENRHEVFRPMQRSQSPFLILAHPHLFTLLVHSLSAAVTPYEYIEHLKVNAHGLQAHLGKLIGLQEAKERHIGTRARYLHYSVEQERARPDTGGPQSELPSFLP